MVVSELRMWGRKGVFHVIKREAENMKFCGPDFDSEEATTLEL